MPALKIYPIAGKGRCVFAGEDIAKGRSIDTNMVILFPKHHGLDPPLQHYPFVWDKDFSCFALGSVSLANHSENPNSHLERDYQKLLIRLVAIRDIKAGEEITYHYRVPLWFEPEPPARLNLKEIENGTSSK